MRDDRPGRVCSGPISRSTTERDYILELLLEHSTADIDYEQAIGVTYEQVHADPDAAIGDIVMRFHEVARVCDAVVIVGSDYTDVASPSELRYNARIAANLGAPVVLVLRGSRRTPAQVADLAELCVAELTASTRNWSRSSPIAAIPTPWMPSPTPCGSSLGDGKPAGWVRTCRPGRCRRCRCSARPR